MDDNAAIFFSAVVDRQQTASYDRLRGHFDTYLVHSHHFVIKFVVTGRRRQKTIAVSDEQIKNIRNLKRITEKNNKKLYQIESICFKISFTISLS